MGAVAVSRPPFADGGLDLPCIVAHDESIGHVGMQHTLNIERDEYNDDTEENVALTIVAHGQPMGDITINRADLIAALGGRLP